VLDFPEFVNVLSRLICDSLDLAVHQHSSTHTHVHTHKILISSDFSPHFPFLCTQPDIDEEEIRRVYDSWDKDGDGTHALSVSVSLCLSASLCILMSIHTSGLISANDLREVVASFGEEWSDENVNDMIYYKKSNGTFAFQVWVRDRETERPISTPSTGAHALTYGCMRATKCTSARTKKMCKFVRRLVYTDNKMTSGFKRCFAGWEAACAACSAQTREPRLISRRWCAVELQLTLVVGAGEVTEGLSYAHQCLRVCKHHK
jgi:hypothetical protein